MPGLGLINNQQNNYTLVRSKRKTLSLEVDRNANLVVRSPYKLSINEIEKYINSKSGWIQKKIISAKSKLSYKPKYIKNEYFLYLGNLYPLIISKQDKHLIFDGYTFILSNDGRKSFLEWYKAEFKKIAVPRLHYYAETYQFKFNKVRIKAQKTLWGSCSSKNNINLNYLLVMAPITVIDYVIVHELSHTVHKNHSPKFWNLIASILPEYKLSVSWLEENGYKLHNL
jgi:predicted metal-dependent hydrolase